VSYLVTSWSPRFFLCPFPCD